MSVFARSIVLAFLLYSSGGTAFAGPGLIIIANHNINIDSATTEQIKNLWLGKTRKLPGTSRIKVADQAKNSDVRVEFYTAIIGKTPGQAKAYWAKVIFTGKAYPPKELPSDTAILRWIARTPNSIAYIDSSAVNDSVKILLEL